MSYTQQGLTYIQQAILAAVKDILDRSSVVNATALYQTLLGNLNTYNSDVQNDLWRQLDGRIGSQWRQGVHQQSLDPVLRDWLRQTLPQIENYLNQQRSQVQQGYGQQVGYGSPAPAYNVSPTSRIYTGDTPQHAHPMQQMVSPTMVDSTQMSDNRFSGYDLGRDVVFDLHRVPGAELPKTDTTILSIDSGYRVGGFENERVSTCDITLNLAQNDVGSAARLVYDYAPQELIRGTFANVIRFNELFHLPIGYRLFNEISIAVNEAYSSKEKEDWRTACEALSLRTISEWRLIDKALAKLLSKVYYRRLRTSAGASIDGIDSIEDLNTLDDRNSQLKTTKHSNYWSVFNTLTSLVTEHLFNAKSIIHPSDPNFGDFVFCSAVVHYSSGKSKYDYGTFQERVDRQSFIEQMMVNNTVIRIPRVIILTNALDKRLVARVKPGGVDNNILLNTVNSIGTTLIEKLDSPKRETTEALICLDKGVSPDSYMEIINLGRTLDNDLVLLR